MDIWRVGIVNDLHIPYHDMRSIMMALTIFKDAKVDEIVLNGDILDFYTINSHGAQHPEIRQTLESEIDAGIEFLENLRKMFPDQKIVFNAGNHEYRLDRWVMNNCPPAWNLLKLKNLLRLEEFKIEYREYQDPYWLSKDLMVVHSPPSYGVNGARTSLLKKGDISAIYACTHRVQHACMTTGSGKVVHAWYNGWLGDKASNGNVFHFTKGHESWQKAAMIVDVFKDGEFSAHQLHLDGEKVTFGDRFYEFTRKES